MNGRTNRRLPPFSSELHQTDTVPIGYGKHNDKDPYDEHTDRQSGHDVAEQDPFSDENVEEVNGFIREDVLVQAKVECIEQRERVYVHGRPQLPEGGRKRGRRRKR